jgi:hypothetical protein
VGYVSRYEQFDVPGPDGKKRSVQFQKAGLLSAGDNPELFFFRVEGEKAVVGVSGEALARLQRGRRYLSREEKIDVAGLFLKQAIQNGRPLSAENLFIREEELAALVIELGIFK